MPLFCCPFFREDLPVAKQLDEFAEDVGEVEEVVTDEVTDPSTVVDDSSRQQRDAEPGQKPGKKPTLDDNPDFRKWKSEQDKRAAQLEKQLAETTKQRAEERQRMAWYEQQLEQLQTRDLDEPSKIVFENNKLKRQLAALTQQQQIEEGRARIFSIIQKEWAEDGVMIPPEVFAEAADADDAWARSRRYASAQMKKNPAMKEAKREANTVDLGGGGTIATDDEWEAKAKRLQKKNDAAGYARHILEKRLG